MASIDATQEQSDVTLKKFKPVTLILGSGPDQKVVVEGGKPLFILGRNGTGKSALVQHFVSELGARAVYIPGSRPSYFDSEAPNMTQAMRLQYAQNSQGWDSSPESRWRSISGTQRNEKAVHDLQTKETTYKIDAADDIQCNGVNSTAIALLQSALSPLDKINSLLKQANLPITLVMKNGLMASRDGDIFSIARMSDGERIAVVLAAEVISAPTQTVFLIDEPELHLHRAIVTSLLASLISSRPDCGFIISTHELELPRTLSLGSLLLIRGVQWQAGIAHSWDFDVLADVNQIPESLYADLLGSRRKILFVEGDGDSLDAPLYALLFPDLSVSFREGCRQVTQAVLGVRAVEGMHRAEAFGLVDNDAMDARQVEDLEARNIYPMSVYSVESLYYCEEVLKAVATIQSEVRRGDSDEYLSEAFKAALKALEKEGVVCHLAARLAERFIRDRALACIPRRKELVAAEQDIISLEISSPYPDELAQLRTLISSKSLYEIVARYPVRESGILDALASGLKFQNREDYELAALGRIAASKELRAKLRSRLGKLAERLVYSEPDGG